MTTLAAKHLSHSPANCFWEYALQQVAVLAQHLSSAVLLVPAFEYLLQIGNHLAHTHITRLHESDDEDLTLQYMLT